MDWFTWSAIPPKLAGETETQTLFVCIYLNVLVSFKKQGIVETLVFSDGNEKAPNMRYPLPVPAWKQQQQQEGGSVETPR